MAWFTLNPGAFSSSQRTLGFVPSFCVCARVYDICRVHTCTTVHVCRSEDDLGCWSLSSTLFEIIFLLLFTRLIQASPQASWGSPTSTSASISLQEYWGFGCRLGSREQVLMTVWQGLYPVSACVHDPLKILVSFSVYFTAHRV